MPTPLNLPYDPIDRAAQSWREHFGASDAMAAATSIMRAQQILLSTFDEILKPFNVTFARYEVLVLLCFSSKGGLPLKVIGNRLMVHPTSVTNSVDRLANSGFVRREPNPADGRGVIATITKTGRHVVEEATQALMQARFGLEGYSPEQLEMVFSVIRPMRVGAGDFPEDSRTS